MSAIERLETLDDLDAAFSQSAQRTVWIFKHSVTCPISARALREYQRFSEGYQGEAPPRFTLIEVQHARAVSNAVAARTGVTHHSPQALLVRHGEVVWHESHFRIKSDALSEAETAAAVS